jgi:N-formylglutamate amidohydrolase
VDGSPLDARSESLTSADVGLAPDAELPFRFSPGAEWSPLVVSFPHVGLGWPAALEPRPQVNFARNADYEVHSLYDRAASLGAASVAARFSRLVVDLNRADDDVSAELVPDHPAPRPRTDPGSVRQVREGVARPRNRGVIWSSAVGNIPLLTGSLRYADLSERLDQYYRPYHAALERLLMRRREMFGYAVLLDGHSMPSTVQGDLILGTLGGQSCAEQVRDLALRALKEPSESDSSRIGLDVRLDDPYQGGELIRRFGRPEEGLHALQLEVSRDLYMDEYRLELWGNTTRTAHPRRAFLAAVRHRVVSLLRVLAGTHPELQ